MGDTVNLQALGAEMEWFGVVLENCLIDLRLHAGEKTPEALPGLSAKSWYGQLIKEHGLGREERLTLMLALLPHIKPETLHSLLQDEECRKRFGGFQGRQFPGVLPTVQTALALLGAASLPDRLEGYALFAPDGVLLARGILRLGSRPPEEPQSAAGLIGKRTDLPVFRVDLSRVVSKYIGETEKNLEQLFRIAEHRNWIIFFDEADALFNKRTDVEDAHDRHANQETAYLLQRLENYPNLVIMATNMQENINSAFTRRFNSGIFFPMPGRGERQRLWNSCLGNTLALSPEAGEKALDYELSGGQIANVVFRLGLWALRNDTLEITPEALKRAVALERVLLGKS